MSDTHQTNYPNRHKNSPKQYPKNPKWYEEDYNLDQDQQDIENKWHYRYE